jgi:enoyl-CoA hydratase/carnithine racemase
MFEMNAPAAKFTADTPVLLRERDGDVAILVLNRPEARNSLSEALLIALSDSLSELATDRTVRAVVLAANGRPSARSHDQELTSRRARRWQPRLFPSGHDLVQPVMQQIVNLPQPMIAAVRRGDCRRLSAGGDCDLAVAPPRPNCDPGVDIGLFCSTPMVALSAMLRASTPWKCC